MFPFMNYHYFTEFYLRNESLGGRIDYLGRVISLNVATPEEQTEWFNFMRPVVLKQWEKDLEYYRKEVQKSIDFLRSEAVRSRNSIYNTPQHCLYWAHKFELQADQQEQQLKNEIFITRPGDLYGYRATEPF